MKLSLPKVRLSAKLLIPLLGIFVMFGGTAAYAVIFGTGSFLGPSQTQIGGQCVTIHSVVMPTPAGRLRLAKFVRMENADGLTRIKTALRVAGLLTDAKSIDLVRVVVVDAHGPLKRADMRARTIGAEVVILLDAKLIEEARQPVIARYREGSATPEGRFYGKKVELSPAEINEMMAGMKDRSDCSEPVVEGAEGKPTKSDKKSNATADKSAPKADGAEPKAPAH